MLPASQVSTARHATVRSGCETSGPRWKTTSGGSCYSTETAVFIQRPFSGTSKSTRTRSSPLGIHDGELLNRAVYATGQWRLVSGQHSRRHLLHVSRVQCIRGQGPGLVCGERSSLPSNPIVHGPATWTTGLNFTYPNHSFDLSHTRHAA